VLLFSVLKPALGDEELDSADEAAVGGSEEQDSLRNFIRDADASKRDYSSLGARQDPENYICTVGY
jgi:hypothetical protein